MTTLTLEIADEAAGELRKEAAALGITVSKLAEMFADQISDGGSGVYDLSDEQMALIKASIDDPSPSIPHEEVMAEMDRLLASNKK